MLAIALLGLLAVQEPDVESLIKQLEGDSVVERDEAAKALIEAGEKAVPKLKACKAASEGALRKIYSQILEQVAIPKKLRGVLPPIDRVNIDAKERSLRDVLEELQIQTRMPMKLGRASQSDRWPKVTVKIEDASPLEALDAICKASKRYWHIPDYSMGGGPMEIVEPEEPKVALLEGPEIRFGSGEYNKPRLFVRHYELEIWEIQITKSNDFRKPSTRSEISFALYWPAGVKPHSVHFDVASAVDERGNQLIEGHDDPSYPKGPRKEVFWTGSHLRFYHRYRLRYPDKETRNISSVRGTVRFNYLLRTKTVMFTSPEASAGTKKEIEGVKAELVEFKPESSYFKGRLRIEGSASGDPPRVRAMMEDGKFSHPFVGRQVRDAPAGLYDFYVSDLRSKFTALEIVVDTVCAEDAFDIEFKDVPLP